MIARGIALLLLAVAVCAGTVAASRAATASVRLRTFRFVDRSRRADFRNGTSGPRVLVTEVRYPAGARGVHPLVVFAHGFAVTPDDYAGLLDTWARAGYVVAAPLFPVERPDAPGGPDRGDLTNEAGDIRFVISRLIAPASPLHALVDAQAIGVAGQSDGGVAALAAAYDTRYRDRRIAAAAILSGSAPLGFTRPSPGSPPLLSMQGTEDPLNPPASTTYYFGLMRRPKFLVWLLGAPHREPYSTDDRWAPVVRSSTTAFFDHFLRRAPLRPLVADGSRPGVARIVAQP